MPFTLYRILRIMSENTSETTNEAGKRADLLSANDSRVLDWLGQIPQESGPERSNITHSIPEDGVDVDRSGRVLLRTVHSLSGTVLQVSKSSKQVLGYEYTELAGTNFFTLVHDRDRADVADSYEKSTQYLETVRYRVRRKDGDLVWLESAYRRVAGHAGEERLEVVSRDVTDQYSVEHALRRELDFSALVLEAANVHVIVADRDGRIVRCNRPQFWKTNAQVEDIIGRRVFDLLNEDVAGESRVSFASLRAHDFPNEGGRYWGYGDRSAEVAWRNSAIVDADNEVEYVVGIGVDPTERQRLEHAVLLTLEEERRRIGQDLHDGLGQLLIGITMIGSTLSARLAEEGYEEAERAQELVTLAREADELAHGLARGLIPIADGERGLVSALQKLSVDIERIFRVRCRCQFHGDVDAITGQSATDLFFIAQEAVSNAIKHAHAHTVHIQLSNTGRELRLAIENDGLPFASDKVDGGKSDGLFSRNGSSGLGTAIMQYRVKRLGGRMAVERNSVENTVIYVTAPIAD